MNDSMQITEEFHETFQTLLKGIIRSLKRRGIIVSEEFTTLIIKLAALDPTNKFLIKQQMVQSELDRMEKIVTNRILGMSEISRSTIEMQLHYKLNYYNRDDSIDVHREDQEIKISYLMDDIKIGIPNNLRHHEYWYAKLIGATVIEADMGPASEGSVIRETEAALKSVFPKNDMNLLTTMNVRDRESELYHLMHIAIGIRLYEKEKDPDNYGPFIENLPENLPNKIEAVNEIMSQMRKENLKRLIMYTTLIQPYFLKNLTFKMGRREVSNDMVKARQGLVMVHQLLIYIKELTDDLNRENQICRQFIFSYKDVMHDLRSTLETSESVPSSMVYPKFVELHKAWSDLQDAAVFVDSTQKLVKYLMQRSKVDLADIDVIVESKLAATNIRVPTEKDFFNFPTIKLPDDKYSLAKRMEFRDDLNPLQMSFTGFCIHSLIKGVGLVIISNPQLGIFNWKNQNFLLSSVKAAIEFRRDPDSFIHKAYAIARRWPELISLLGIDKEAYDIGTVSDADRSKKTTNVLISSEAECQTSVHPVSSRIVEHYTWNEWDLRRRGLILSKIHKCRTHGTQTHWQALKHNAESQTFGIKSKAAQTNTNVHTELGLNQFYVYGLRGLHCGIPPHVVEITPEAPLDMKCKFATQKEIFMEIEGGNPFQASEI